MHQVTTNVCPQNLTPNISEVNKYPQILIFLIISFIQILSFNNMVSKNMYLPILLIQSSKNKVVAAGNT